MSKKTPPPTPKPSKGIGKTAEIPKPTPKPSGGTPTTKGGRGSGKK